MCRPRRPISIASICVGEAVRIALTNELARQEPRVPLAERLKPLLDKMDAVPRTGLEADKAFYDSLNDE